MQASVQKPMLILIPKFVHFPQKSESYNSNRHPHRYRQIQIDRLHFRNEGEKESGENDDQIANEFLVHNLVEPYTSNGSSACKKARSMARRGFESSQSRICWMRW